MYSPSYSYEDRRRGERHGRVVRSRDSYDRPIYRDNDVEILRTPTLPARRSPPGRSTERDTPSRRFVVNVQPRPSGSPSDAPPNPEAYVTVKLPLLNQPPWSDGSLTVGLEYRLKRRQLVRFLPNTARAVAQGDSVVDLMRFFPDEVLRDNPTWQIREACVFVFDFIDNWATRGRQDPFEDTMAGIAQARNRRRAVMDAAARLLSLCRVLHRQTGMGCGGQLLDRVCGFAEELFDDWGGYLTFDNQIALFSTLLGVCGPSRRGLLHRSMQGIWVRLDFLVRQQVVEGAYRRRFDGESGWEEWVLLMDLEYESGRFPRGYEQGVGGNAGGAQRIASYLP